MAQRSFVARLRSAGGPSHDLLVLLDAHRVMTTGQLARATSAPERTTRYRLDRLHEAGLIGFARPGRETGSAPQHWWLKPAGARIVTGTAAAEGSPSGMFVAHAAAITEVWLALRENGPAAGVTLTGWAADRAGWQEWPPPGGLGVPRRLTPDAAAEAAVDGGQAAFFVEVDLASMTQTQLKAKLERYLTYAEDRAWTGVFPHCPPMLLLTTTAARAATFMRAAARVLAAHERAIGRRWGQAKEVVHAEALMVAACGVVRDPARAVTEHCWLLPDPALGEIQLAELLGERVSAAAAARRVRAARTAAEQHAEDAALLAGLIHREPSTLRADLGEHAAEILGYLDRHDARLIDTHPDVATALLSWSQGREPLVTTAQIRELLERLHRQAWAEQARAVLALHDRIAADDPRLRARARTLAAGHLLARGVLSDLARPPGATRAQLERQSLAAHARDRDTHVTAQHAALPWLTRRRTDPAVLAVAYDEQHLLICSVCAMPIPSPDPDGERWQDAEQCPHCHGTPLPYTRRSEVPTLADVLTQLQQRLDEATSG